MRIDHIAILVEDVAATASAWELPEAQAAEEFPSEGTRELYCGAANRSGRVLLMQPIGPGPYRRAMAKRGPGLHHIAVCVEDLLGLLARSSRSGWLMHPTSLETYEAHGQAWLCRPGFPCLVEVNEGSRTYQGAYVEEVVLSIPEALVPMLEALECAELRRTSESRHSLAIGDRTIWIG